MSDMNSMLKLIAPNTMGGSGGKGGQTTAPTVTDPSAPSLSAGAQPSKAVNGTALMPIADPMAWTKMSAGNFTPGTTDKGGMMKMMGGTGGGG